MPPGIAVLIDRSGFEILRAGVHLKAENKQLDFNPFMGVPLFTELIFNLCLIYQKMHLLGAFLHVAEDIFRTFPVVFQRVASLAQCSCYCRATPVA